MFVPEHYEVPRAMALTTATGAVVRLEPLGLEHNARDHRAWTSSMDHIHRSPGFAERPWPHPMTLEENAGDLVAHAEDFAARRGFTYTVLDSTDDVVGCVYIYPDDSGTHDAAVRSWVRADHADLDGVLRRTVADWLRAEWPFTSFAYAGVDVG